MPYQSNIVYYRKHYGLIVNLLFWLIDNKVNTFLINGKKINLRHHILKSYNAKV